MPVEFAGRTLKIVTGGPLERNSECRTTPVRIECPTGEGHLVFVLDVSAGLAFRVVLDYCPVAKESGADGDDIKNLCTLAWTLSSKQGPTSHSAKPEWMLFDLGYDGAEPCGQDYAGHVHKTHWEQQIVSLMQANARAVDQIREMLIVEHLRELETDVSRMWETLHSKIEMRDAARRFMRDRASVSLSPRPGSPCGYELREFDDLPRHLHGLDEVVATGISFLHAETLSDDGLWIGATLVDGRRLAINVSGRRLRMRAEIDDDPSNAM